MRQSMASAVGMSRTMPKSEVSCSRMAPSQSQKRELQPETMVRMTVPEPRAGVIALGSVSARSIDVRHDGEAAAVGEAVGIDGDEHVGDDAEESERRPQPDDGKRAAAFG